MSYLPKADELYITGPFDSKGDPKGYADIEHEHGKYNILITTTAAGLDASNANRHEYARAFANRIIRALRVLDSIESSL